MRRNLFAVASFCLLLVVPERAISQSEGFADGFTQMHRQLADRHARIAYRAFQFETKLAFSATAWSGDALDVRIRRFERVALTTLAGRCCPDAAQCFTSPTPALEAAMAEAAGDAGISPSAATLGKAAAALARVLDQAGASCLCSSPTPRDLRSCVPGH